MEVASDLADKYDAKMILVHVLGESTPPEALRRMVEAERLVTRPRHTDLFKSFEYPEMAAMRSEVAREKYFHQIFIAAGEQLVERGKRLSREKGVKEVITIIREGKRADEILACAEKDDADLIAIGSRDLGNIEGIFLGSVSQKVAQRAKGCCLTVK